MKKYFLILLWILFPLFLISCSDDDDKETRTLTIEGLTKGTFFISDMIPVDQGYYNLVSLVSDGIDIHSKTGTGDIISLEIFSSVQGVIENCTYNVGDNENFPPGTFTGFCAINLNIETSEFAEFYGIKSGTVTVSKSGDIYEFTIDVFADQKDGMLGNTIEKDVKITCYYQGTLNEGLLFED